MEIALQRANIYRFFSIVYSKEPTPEFVDEIAKEPLRDILMSLGITFDDVFEKDNAAEELSFEYVRVFVGAGPKHVPPYESVYVDARQVGDKEVERLMWGPSTEAVAQFYAKLEYEPEDKFKDMPDHIGVELGFLEQLCLEEAESYESGKIEKARFLMAKQLSFLNEHLLRWIEPFVEEIQEFTNFKFYSSVAKVTQAYLLSEKQYLSEEVEKNV